jgi:hypothetical protein
MRILLLQSVNIAVPGTFDRITVLAGRTVEVGGLEGARLVAAGAASGVADDAALDLPSGYASRHDAVEHLRAESGRGWPFTRGAAPTGAAALLG